MDPFFTRNRMSDYLDNSLSPQAKRDFEEAIANNSELAEELQALKATKALLKEHGEAEPPPDLFDSILNHVENAKPTEKRWLPIVKFGLMAAAATLAVVVWSKQDKSPLAEETVDAGGVVSRASTPNKPEKTAQASPKTKPSNDVETATSQSKSKPRSRGNQRQVASFVAPPVNPAQHIKDNINAEPIVEEKSSLSKENHLGDHLHLVSNDSVPKKKEKDTVVEMVIDDAVVGNRISTNDPMILKKIHGLKSNYSNLKVLKRNGDKFQPYSISEDEHYRALKLIAPTSEWADLKKSLMAHGAEMIKVTNKKGQTVAEAEIEILYEDEP